MIQRIGQKPIGYALEAPPGTLEEKDKQALIGIGGELKTVIEDIRGWAKDTKLETQQELLRYLQDPSYNKSKSIRWFANEVDKRGKFSRKTIRGDKEFNELLKKHGLEYVEDPAKKQDVVRRASDNAVVLTLYRGDEAFEEAGTQPPGAVRTVYNKRGKGTGRNNEYVKDDMGVFTRRYAYLEKNKYQLHDLLNRGVLKGRWPLDQTVEARERPYNEINPKLHDKVSGLPNAKTFTHAYQLAYVHQELGSGPQQRGVSATSTPVHEVFSNQGESFRTEGGVRIEVDLARVPAGTTTQPNFVNHYAYQARKNAQGQIGNFAIIGDEPRGYDHYRWSVKKNRELFLKTVEPAFVTSLTWHKLNVGDQTYRANQTDIDSLKQNIYLAEFRAGLANPDGTPTYVDADATAAYKEGQQARKDYESGKRDALAFWKELKDDWTAEKNRLIDAANRTIERENIAVEARNSRKKHGKEKLKPLKARVSATDYEKSSRDFDDFQNYLFTGRDATAADKKTLNNLSRIPAETRYVQGAWDGYYGRAFRL